MRFLIPSSAALLLSTGLASVAAADSFFPDRLSAKPPTISNPEVVLFAPDDHSIGLGSGRFIYSLRDIVMIDGAGPDRNRHLHLAFARMLDEGRARGDVAPDRDIAFLSELVLASWLGILINWVTLPDYPIRERLGSLADLVADAIGGRR